METDTSERQVAGDLPRKIVVKSAIDARQGVISFRVVTVLAVSLLLVIIGLAVAYAFIR